MNKQKMKELSQEILELSYGSEQFDLDELQSYMAEIHELASEIQHELGVKSIVQKIGWKPTGKQQEIVASFHLKKSEVWK